MLMTYNCCNPFPSATDWFNNTNTKTGKCRKIERKTSANIYAYNCTVRIFCDNACHELVKPDFSEFTGLTGECVHLTLDPAKQNSTEVCPPNQEWDSWHFYGSWRVDCSK